MGENIQADEYFMRRAILLARRGEGRTSPNPLVGAVIVRDGKIVAEGYHRRYGDRHAEIDALEKAPPDISRATFYINLEPCSHYGKTPPCVEALIARRPRRVVIGTIDPNPLVCGKGVAALQKKGIPVTIGVLEEECRRLNEVFFKFVSTGLPFVTMKFAQTLDGRIATANGNSRWISSEPARKFAHRLRATHDAVLVGSGTVLSDDPQLTCRLVKGRNPRRVILDSGLSVPLSASIFQDASVTPTIVAATEKAPLARVRKLEERGVKVLRLPEDPQGRIALGNLLQELGRENISSLLVEGGSSVITSFLRAGLADRLVAVIAPKIIGAGINTVGELGVREMDDAWGFELLHVKRLGPDLVIDARVKV